MRVKIKTRTYQTPDRYMKLPILIQKCLYLYKSIDTDTRKPIPIPIPILVQENLYPYKNIDTYKRILIP